MAIKILATASSKPARATSRRQPVAAADFRHITQVLRVLDEIEDDLSATQQLLKKATDAVKASSLFKIVETDIKTSPEADAAERPKVKPAELKAIQQNYTVTQKLFKSLNDLNTLEATLRSTFPEDSKDGADAISRLAKVRATLKKQLDQAFAFLQDSANAKLPPTFAKFTAGVARAMSRSLSYTDAAQYVYLFTTDEGNLAFSNYLMLKNLVDENEQQFATLFIVSTLVIGADREANKTFVTVMRDFAPPSDDLLVTPVDGLPRAFGALSVLLDLEHFKSSLGDMKVPLLTADKLDKKLFTHNRYIEQLEVDPENGSLIFYLKPTVQDAEKVTEITTQLNREVQTMIRATRHRLEMHIRRGVAGKATMVRFYMRKVDGAPAARPEDVQVIVDRFNLGTDAAKQLLRVLNS